MPISARVLIARTPTALRALCAGGCALLCAFGAPLNAQTMENAISRPVVQPLPPPGVERLNTALRRLARNSRNVDALIDAGDASLDLDDIDAAIGFFGRAEELSPDNPRVKMGLGAAYVRQEQPVQALALFDAAQAAGASTAKLAGDRALAYDLVGDNASAMGFYRQALGQREDAQTRRRFALSHAISGDRGAFEAVLAPLIEKQDFASYRTRAFGLAILGDEDEAIAIAEAVMPKNLSARIAPYLRYMPRLTKAQQAAAANFGSFPRAAQIGRDTPQIAQYTGNNAAARNADARLAPQGEPLGPRTDATSQRRRPDRGRSAVESVAQQADAAVEAPVQVAQLPEVRVTEIAAVETKETDSKPSETVRPVVAESGTRPAAGNPQVAQATAPSTVNLTGPKFDLATAANAPATKSEVDPETAEAESVAEAFASFATAPSTRAPASGGVDITKISPPREVAKKPEPKAEPEKPKHPRRFWVQIATGRDRDALKFDWRRISRKAPDILGDLSGHVTPWGQSNRLLAGPFPNARAARNAMNSLKELDIDSFTFTSPEGQEIDKL